MNEETNAGIVFGVLGISCGVISLIVCWWLAIVGLVLGLIGLMFPKRVCSGIAVGLCLISLIISLVVFSSLGLL